MFDHNVLITDCRIVIGGTAWAVSTVLGDYDGLLDEIVVFNRVLSIPEIDTIRNGTYTYSHVHDLRLVKKASPPA